MLKKISTRILVGVAVGLFFWILNSATSAHAQTATLHNSCQDGTYSGNMGNWDWPKFIQQNGGGDNRNSGSTYMPEFDKENSSYFIYRIPSQQTLYNNATLAGSPSTYDGWTNYSWNQYTMIVSTDNTNRLAMYETTSTDQWIANNPITMRKYTIIDGTANNQTNVFGGTSVLTTQQSINTVAVSCALVAHNVDYKASWTYTQITSNITSGSEIVCNTLDLGCHVAGIFRGVANTFTAVGQAILKGIAFLFTPTDKAQEAFSSLNTFLQDKLGFLVYPVTFMVDMFDAMGEGGSWCNTTTCTKNFGNFLGQNFTVNLNQPATVMPTYWNWLLALIRAVTIFTLVLAVRNKLKGITAK